MRQSERANLRGNYSRYSGVTEGQSTKPRTSQGGRFTMRIPTEQMLFGI